MVTVPSTSMIFSPLAALNGERRDDSDWALNFFNALQKRKKEEVKNVHDLNFPSRNVTRSTKVNKAVKSRTFLIH